MGSIPLPPTADTTFSNNIGISHLPLPSPPSSPLPKIALLSLGEMGLGIATLLHTYHYPLLTCLSGRSASTISRAASLSILDLSFEEMIAQADIFLSIVPPSEALALGRKVAASTPSGKKLVYLDLNAISPALSRSISEPLIKAGITYIDGSILGFPPKLLSPPTSTHTPPTQTQTQTWFRPALPISGPAFPFPELGKLMNLNSISKEVGAASGLKMCFGAINKSLTAVTIQSYSTALSLGILDPLRKYMGDYYPDLKTTGEAAMIASQRKAYRWVTEMEEVGATFEEEGGWGRDVWNGIGGVFSTVAGLEGRKEGVEGVARDVRGVLEERRRRGSC